MGTIFISHSSKDNSIAIELKRQLKIQRHRSVFLDFDPELGIPPGRDWEQELYRELRACHAVIVLCSEHSMSSRWCFVEITHAKSLGKHVFPVKVGPCTIDPVLMSSQIIDLTQNEGDAYQRLWRGLKVAGLDPADIFDWDGNRSPYPGMMAFQEEDAAVFFGREAEIQQGLETLQRLRQFGGARMLLVHGGSGSGKSSLVRAGLLPRLRRNPGLWLIVDPFRPLDHPLRELSIVLADAFSVIGQKRNWKDICEQFEQAAMADNTQAKSILNDMSLDLKIESGRRESTPLLIIDQAEELLVQCSEGRAASFFSLLSSALEEPNSSLMTIFTLRSDFLGEYQRQKGLLGLPCEHFPVGPMAPEYLPKIIEGPAAIAAIELEDGLTEAMVQDTENQDAIPLLAFALRELYEHCGDDKRLEVKEYREKLGGLSGAVSRAAESALKARQLSADQEQVLRNALVSLARINEEGQFTRQAVHWSDFPESVHDVLESFVQARLLISRGQEADRVLEVAHEKLFHSWEKLRNWLFEDEEFLLWKRRFGLLLGEWQHTGKNKSALLRGPSLKEAQRWQRKRPKGISSHEHEFIKNSLKIAHRGKWIRRGFVAIVLLVLTLGAAIQQWTESKDFQVNSLLFSSPEYLPNAMLSTGVKFYQTLEIAGKIGDIGTLRSDFPVIKALRINSQWYQAHLLVLSYASRFLSNQGKTMQANDLVEKMLEVSNSLIDIQADPPTLTSMSFAFHAAGRVEEARDFANKALAAARAWPVYDYRFVFVGAVSHMFAKIGMSLEAEMVIKEALDALPSIEARPARIVIANWVSLALVRLGRTQQAIETFSQGGDPRALPLFTQALVDEGRLKEAQSFAQKYQNAFSMVIVASAFASAGKADRSLMLIKESLYLLNQMPVSLETLRVRELLLSKVLLKVAKPREALAMVKELGDLNGLGLLASILAEAKERSLTREAAQEAIEAAHAASEIAAGSRALSLAAKSLALIGDTDDALALIHEIESEEFQTFALSNVAQGFAERGDLNRAEELLPELDERVAKITDQALKSLSWANTTKVRVYLGNYKAAAEADINTLSPNDLISVYETVLRKYTIERNPKLKKLFVEKTNTGLGVYGVQWP